MNPITNLHQNQNKVIVSMGYDNITTNITLAEGYGAMLPDVSTPYNLIWWNASDYLSPTDDPSVEIVKCIAKFGDTLVTMRSQQQTLASPKNIPGKLYNMAYLPDNNDNNLVTLSYYNVPQIHDKTKHDATTIDGGTALPIGQLPTHGIGAHTGTIGTWANIDKTTSSITDITTRSHTLLIDIGTNTHATIDTHIAAAGTSVHGLGTMSTQAANAVAITGGTIIGLTNLEASGSVSINSNRLFLMANADTNHYIEANNAILVNTLRFHEYGDFLFETNSGQIMIIKSDGKVGIGTTTPTAKLHIGGTSGVDGIKFPDGTTQTTAVTSGPTLVGVTPTLSGSWATAPAPLSEIVNGDEVAFTTAGAINWGAGRCYITLDSGSTKPGILLYYFSTGRSGSTGANHILEASPNGSTWTTILAANTAGTTQSGIFGMQGIRYVRFSIDTTNTGTAYLYNLSLTLK